MRKAGLTDFVIVTGLSGAGKSQVLHVLEDLGFFCVDNLPPTLLPKFAELCADSQGNVRRVALVTDIRGRAFFADLQWALDQLRQLGVDYRVLFLEASSEQLVNRYKETRRRHPLASRRRTLLEAIQLEREQLQEIRGLADKVVDTSNVEVRNLRDDIARLFVRDTKRASGMLVSVLSFGYKYGIPLDADLVFDVRFMPNPHYVPAMKGMNGTDAAVADYVFTGQKATDYWDLLQRLIDFSLPLHAKEGKTFFTVAFGCTGGRHRSVAIAERLADHLRTAGYRVRLEHRDIKRKDQG